MDDAGSSRPRYDVFTPMNASRAVLAGQYCDRILATCAPLHARPPTTWDVLDVGSGYGHTTAELARRCRSAVGCEPARELFDSSLELALDEPDVDLSFRLTSVYELTDTDAFDLIVLDNVYEHLPDHAGALEVLTRALRPGGLLFILTPNKLWPIEAHYRLPFLALLPLPWANRYLRLSGRGEDYLDASYAPTYRSLRRDLGTSPALRHTFVLPRSSDAAAGFPLHYRLGMAAIERLPALWAISKSLLVVAVKG
jgi:SAM-dependent methyltransferase